MRPERRWPKILSACPLVFLLAVGSCGGDDEPDAPSGAECQVGGQTCNNSCSASLGCVQCLKDGDCAGADGACVRGRCEECATDADCAAGQVCHPGRFECGDPCADDGDCDGPWPDCDTATGLCVGCAEASDCQQGVCDALTKRCTECTRHEDCDNGELCDLQDGDCVECLVDAHCSGAQRCGGDRECHFSCKENSDCTDSEQPVCHPDSGDCVQCFQNSHCSGQTPICVDRRCEQCATNGDCPAATPICDNEECVECAGDSDCTADPNLTDCQNNVCVAP